jgi:hypothetical protein
MDADELAVATQFRIALEQAAKTGNWTLVYPCLAPDVEWITPQRTLIGIDKVERDLTWGVPPENLDVEFQIGDWVDLDAGHAAVHVHETYRMKRSGDFAYERERRIEITIRDGKISRYEMKIVG